MAQNPGAARHPLCGTRTWHELSVPGLGVDQRTVRRYVDHLIDLDEPVESVRGGTAVTGSRQVTRRLLLTATDDETVAAVLARRATRSGHCVLLSRARPPRCTGCCPARSPCPTPSWRQPRNADEGDLRRPLREGACPPCRPGLLFLARWLLPRQKGTATEMGARAVRRRRPPGTWYATGLDSRSGQVRSFSGSGSRTLSSTGDRCPRGLTWAAQATRCSRGVEAQCGPRSESKAASGWYGCGCPDHRHHRADSTNGGRRGCDGAQVLDGSHRS